VGVSTEEQAQEGFSIRAQEQKLKDYAKIKDWSIYNIYIDEGISGKDITGRPAINEMIGDIKNGYVKNVVVFKIDRITRSTADLIYLIDLFNEYDCAFNSLSESIDTQTPSGRMFLKIIGIFAEFERENIGERVRLGCERKVREGYSLCAVHSSYGYDRENGQKIQTINEEQAIIVRQIFDWFVNQNMSLAGIAKRLNIMKIPTKKGSAWTANTAKRVLTNCSHVGKVRYKFYDKNKHFEADGLHEAIVTQEIYDQAQKLIAKNKKVVRSKKPRKENYFLGFLHCPKCGWKLQAHGTYQKKADGTTPYTGAYRCHFRNVRACDFPYINHNKLEKAFIEYAQKIAVFEAIDDIKPEEQQKNTEKTKELTQAYHEKLNQLNVREKEILGLYVDGDIVFEHYRDIKDKIDKDKKDFQLEIEKLSDTEDKQAEITKEDLVLVFKENWEHLTDTEKRQFLMKFVEKIYISAQRTENGRHWLVTVEDVEFAACV